MDVSTKFSPIDLFATLCVLVFFLVGCGGGGSSSGSDTSGSDVELTNLPIMYSGIPTQDQQTTISLATDEDVGDVEWLVASEPPSSNLVLSTSVDNKTITYTASEPGDYQILARSLINGTGRSTSFTISPSFPFDELQIEGNDGSLPIDQIIGVIKNQSWVYSISLTESQLRDIIASYPLFVVIGYDSIKGLLVEFDNANTLIQNELERLRLEKGIASVESRVHVGENADILFFRPNDGSLFIDNGDNWHLERINAPDAWDISQGNPDLLIGVTDKGYYPSHEDLIGRFERWPNFKDPHGTAVSGAIGSITDNSLGISGVNHHSKISAVSIPEYGSFARRTSAKVINNSWGEMGNNSGSVSRGVSFTRKHRETAERTLNKLHVWAAGNDGANAATQNGAIHLVENRHTNSYVYSEIENAMVVGAVGIDGTLLWYSDYGPTVDIAAPSEYRSPAQVDGSQSNYFEANSPSDYGFHNSGGFNGTSAAAPIVSGVASLIYSLYSGFSGKEVKDIIVESATEFVTSRHISDTNESTESVFSIPILNASAALQKAQEILDSKIRLNYSIPDPFTPQARIAFESIDKEFEVITLDWSLQSTSDNGASWDFVSSMAVDGKVAEPMLLTDILNYRFVTTVTLRNVSDNSEITSNSAYEFNYSNFTVNVGERQIINLDVLDPLVGVTVEVEPLLESPSFQTRETGIDGKVSVYLKSGVYKLRGDLSGYDEVVKLLVVDEPEIRQLDLNMVDSKVTGLLVTKQPDSTITQVGVVAAPSILSVDTLCLVNNDTPIALPNNPVDVCDSLDTPNTSDPLLHECSAFAPWIRLDPSDVSCSIEGNPSVYLNLANVEYTGDVSEFSHYLKNTTAGVTRIIDMPDLLGGQTVCWAIAGTPVEYQDEVDDLQLPGVRWAEVDYAGIDSWVGGCGTGQRGYVGIDTVFSY